MEVKLLEHHFAQLSTAWSNSRNNLYSDKRKEEYHKKLGFLYAKLESEDFSILKSNDVVER